MQNSFQDLAAYAHSHSLNFLIRDETFMEIVIGKESDATDPYYAFMEVLVDKFHDYFKLTYQQRSGSPRS